MSSTLVLGVRLSKCRLPTRVKLNFITSPKAWFSYVNSQTDVEPQPPKSLPTLFNSYVQGELRIPLVLEVSNVRVHNSAAVALHICGRYVAYSVHYMTVGTILSYIAYKQ